MKNKLKKVLVILLILTICISTININAFAVENGGGSTENDWDGITRESVYEGEGFKITFGNMV